MSNYPLDSLEQFRSLSIDDQRVAYSFILMCVTNKEMCFLTIYDSGNQISLYSMSNLTDDEYADYLRIEGSIRYFNSQELFYDHLKLQNYNFATGSFNFLEECPVYLSEPWQYGKLTSKAKLSVNQTIKVLLPSNKRLVVLLSLQEDGVFDIQDIFAENEPGDHVEHQRMLMPASKLSLLLGGKVR